MINISLLNLVVYIKSLLRRKKRNIINIFVSNILRYLHQSISSITFLFFFIMKAHKNKWFAISFSAFASSVLLFNLGLEGSTNTFIATVCICILCYLYTFYQIYNDDNHRSISSSILFALIAAGIVHLGLHNCKCLLNLTDTFIISVFIVWCTVTYIYFAKKGNKTSSDIY